MKRSCHGARQKEDDLFSAIVFKQLKLVQTTHNRIISRNISFWPSRKAPKMPISVIVAPESIHSSNIHHVFIHHIEWLLNMT